MRIHGEMQARTQKQKSWLLLSKEITSITPATSNWDQVTKRGLEGASGVRGQRPPCAKDGEPVRTVRGQVSEP